jgi:hypothetical protein
VSQPDIFWHLTATGWTAIGSVVSAVSILLLSVFNVLYLCAAKKQAAAAQQTLGLLHEQMVMSERPFVAIHSKYDQEIDTVIVRAVSQGSGPALDVEALLVFEPGAESGQVEYGIGCLAVGEKFHFLIGQDSRKLNSAALRYRSISGRRWRTAVRIMGGHPVFTDVGLDTDERTLMEFAFGQPTPPKC